MTDKKQMAIDHVFETIDYISNESDETGALTTIGKVKGQIEMLFRIQMITNDEAGELYTKLDAARQLIEQKITKK